MNRENQVLWKEISTLRQRHHQQQQIVNKVTLPNLNFNL
jgi:predicted component of type VI protein secretion system